MSDIKGPFQVSQDHFQNFCSRKPCIFCIPLFLSISHSPCPDRRGPGQCQCPLNYKKNHDKKQYKGQPLIFVLCSGNRCALSGWFRVSPASPAKKKKRTIKIKPILGLFVSHYRSLSLKSSFIPKTASTSSVDHSVFFFKTRVKKDLYLFKNYVKG